MKKIKPWKRIASKVVFDSEHLSVSEDKLTLPHGKEKQYTRLTAGQAHSVIIIALNRKQEVLVQKEYSYPPDKIMWQLPGGSIETGEEICVAANRELAEESGYQGKSTEILGYFYTMNRISDQKQYVVLCTRLVPYKLQENEDEFIETYWMPKSKIKKMIADSEIDNINLLAAMNIWFQYPKRGKKT